MREWLIAALADLPMLREFDDSAGAGSRLTYLMVSFDAPGWSGAALYRSPGGFAWSQVGRALGESAWGATVIALDVPLSGSPAFRADAAPALAHDTRLAFDLAGTQGSAAVSKLRSRPWRL